LSELRNSITQADTYLLIYDRTLRIDFTRITRSALWYIDAERKYYPVLYHWVNILFGNISELPLEVKSALGNPTIADIALLFFTQTLELLKLKTNLMRDNWQVVEPLFSLPNEKVLLWESLLYYQQLHTPSKPGHLVKNFIGEEPPTNLMGEKEVEKSLENVRSVAHSIETLTLMSTAFANFEDDPYCQNLAIKLLQRATRSIEEQSKNRITSDLKLFSLKCNNCLISIAQRAYQKGDHRKAIECLSDIKTYVGLMLLAKATRDQPDEPSALVDARIKFLSAASAEDATEDEKRRALEAAQECRSQMTEEKIEKARESKRQSRKISHPRLARRHSTGQTNSNSKGNAISDIYETPKKSPTPFIDLVSPTPSGSSIIVPPSPREINNSPSNHDNNNNPRQKLLLQNVILTKEYENLSAKLYT